jgi:glycerol-3-phosphate dehydrogenase
LEGQAPIVNIFGGKITTYRRLSEAMLEKIENLLGAMGKPWTATAPLPGGDFPANGFEAEVRKLKEKYEFLSQSHARRLVRLYGTKASSILGLAKSTADLGRRFGADLFEAEVRYLVRSEWAVTAEDILWRRTKRGLHLNSEQAAVLDKYMREFGDRHDAAAE